MIRVTEERGGLRLRSREVSGRAQAGFLALALSLSALAALFFLLAGEVGDLTCDRASGECVARVDGAVAWRVPIAEVQRAHARRAPTRGNQYVRAYEILLVTRGPPLAYSFLMDEALARARAAAIDRFLASGDPGPLRFTDDRRGPLRTSFVLLLPLLFAPVVIGRISTLCVVDRGAGTVTVRGWGWDRRRLADLVAVKVQSHAEHTAEMQRYTPQPAPPSGRAAERRRIVFVPRAGLSVPATAWLGAGEDLEPALAALRAATGLA